jgi:hypothetical protein
VLTGAVPPVHSSSSFGRIAGLGAASIVIGAIGLAGWLRGRRGRPT